MPNQSLTEKQKFEQFVKNTLAEVKPDPKYDLWQEVVIYRSGVSTPKEGLIVGCYWQSVYWCFRNTSPDTSFTPGWCYVVEVDGNDHTQLDEFDIDEFGVIDGDRLILRP
ncbi:MAG: hypothetical protein KME43_11400 [Myxacorys chilensis ATA2-1-KO14]|jgi:hypothetical protein|nr:hypothetical protein [Myxacorys chilensis ATA2-1-KO14]